MKKLKPIHIPLKIEKEIEKEIMLFFYKTIFYPVFQLKKDIIYNNSKEEQILQKAFSSGKIEYKGNLVIGVFDAKIVKALLDLGAKYDKNFKGYRLEYNVLPKNIQSAITSFNIRNQKYLQNIFSFLGLINVPHKLDKITFYDKYKKVIDNIDLQYYQTVSKIIGITPDLTDELKMKIAKEYSENLKLYIKDFTEEKIIQLRELVNQKVIEGRRAESLEALIQEQYEISVRKAKFLARQETSLLTAQYRQFRYQQAGINDYIWETAKDSKVRESHRELQGKLFNFDNPPIENPQTGNRANPGQAFGCRCLASPAVAISRFIN